MDVVYSYSHLGGEEILMVRHPQLHTEIHDVIRSISNPGRGKLSKEKTKRGWPFSPRKINSLFKESFRSRGWREHKDYYEIAIPDYPHRIAGAYKQCDFFKDPVLVEVQFGKYAFMFYDLAKFRYFYNKAHMRVGVEIVPCHFLKSQMSTGVSYGEQLIYDLERLSKNFPSVPVNIILVDMPLDTDDYHAEGRKDVRRAYADIRKLMSRWPGGGSSP